MARVNFISLSETVPYFIGGYFTQRGNGNEMGYLQLLKDISRGIGDDIEIGTQMYQRTSITRSRSRSEDATEIGTNTFKTLAGIQDY